MKNFLFEQTWQIVGVEAEAENYFINFVNTRDIAVPQTKFKIPANNRRQAELASLNLGRVICITLCAGFNAALDQAA